MGTVYVRAAGGAALLLAFGVWAQQDSPAAGPASTDPVALEVFKGPQKKKALIPPVYPSMERMNYRDGWVNLNFMIDRDGKPYEIMVTDSTGNKALEQAAIDGAAKWSFEPATLNGEPVEAGYTVKVTFVLEETSGANREFARRYREFMALVKAGDRAGAEAALQKLRVQNLYEDAYLGLAQYEFARQWGTRDGQLAGIKRAVALESTSRFLPKQTFIGALELMLNLQIGTHDFAGSLRTWEALRENAGPETLAAWQKPIAEVEALRTSTRSYSVDGAFGDSTSCISSSTATGSRSSSTPGTSRKSNCVATSATSSSSMSPNSCTRSPTRPAHATWNWSASRGRHSG